MTVGHVISIYFPNIYGLSSPLKEESANWFLSGCSSQSTFAGCHLTVRFTHYVAYHLGGVLAGCLPDDFQQPHLGYLIHFGQNQTHQRNSNWPGATNGPPRLRVGSALTATSSSTDQPVRWWRDMSLKQNPFSKHAKLSTSCPQREPGWQLLYCTWPGSHIAPPSPRSAPGRFRNPEPLTESAMTSSSLPSSWAPYSTQEIFR